MTRVAPDAQSVRRPAGTRQPMPTLAACAVACLALVTAVGLQSPAVSAGLRWRPRPRSRTLDLTEFEATEIVIPTSDLETYNDWLSWLMWTLAALAAVAVVTVVVRHLRRIGKRAPATNVARIGADSRAPSEADARVLHSGLVAAIEILATERDPGNAVVQAWQSLQDAAAAAGVTRRAAETASEFTARILYRSRGSAAPIAVLLSLYQHVRFGEHVPDAGEIAAARESLAVLVELWQVDLPGRRPMAAAR